MTLRFIRAIVFPLIMLLSVFLYIFNQLSLEVLIETLMATVLTSYLFFKIYYQDYGLMTYRRFNLESNFSYFLAFILLNCALVFSNSIYFQDHSRLPLILLAVIYLLTYISAIIFRYRTSIDIRLLCLPLAYYYVTIISNSPNIFINIIYLILLTVIAISAGNYIRMLFGLHKSHEVKNIEYSPGRTYVFNINLESDRKDLFAVLLIKKGLIYRPVVVGLTSDKEKSNIYFRINSKLIEEYVRREIVEVKLYIPTQETLNNIKHRVNILGAGIGSITALYFLNNYRKLDSITIQSQAPEIVQRRKEIVIKSKSSNIKLTQYYSNILHIEEDLRGLIRGKYYNRVGKTNVFSVPVRYLNKLNIRKNDHVIVLDDRYIR